MAKEADASQAAFRLYICICISAQLQYATPDSGTWLTSQPARLHLEPSPEKILRIMMTKEIRCSSSSKV